MPEPKPWMARAYNPVPESENRIHSDEVAQKFGFKGGLVPGVTVSAYLIHPAIEAWGMDWLERGSAEVVVKQPLYHGQDFQVRLESTGERAYGAELLDPDGALCAKGRVGLPDSALAPPTPPVMRGDRPLGPDHERLHASREVFERLREQGMGAARVRWSQTAMASYLTDASAMPRLLRPDAEGYANPSFVLGMTNWALSANVYLSPWLHLQTEHQNYAAIAPGSELAVEISVADLFEKKGHEFVDLNLAAFLLDETPVMSCRLRAIYKLRS